MCILQNLREREKERERERKKERERERERERKRERERERKRDPDIRSEDMKIFFFNINCFNRCFGFFDISLLQKK